MDYSIITRLENLPVEVLMEIFVYFTATEIYLSFSQLNNRLNLILKSLPNLVLVIREHLDSSVLSFFYSFNKILMKFSGSRSYGCDCQFHSINGGNRLYEIYPTLDNEWYSRYSIEIENIIRPDIYSRLQSLVLPATPPKLTQLIFRSIFPRLRICHFGKCKSIILPLSMTIQQLNFRQLTIREQNGCELERILLVCSSLVYLDFSCNNIPRFILINRCFPSMKYLRLGRLKNFFFHNGQFDFLLSLFPNLLQFSLTADQCREHVETIQFREIAHYLRHRCPLLKILVLRIYMQGHMRSSYNIGSFKKITEMHSLFNYIDKCGSRLMISSHGFIQHHVYTRRYARTSFK
ncbi:unnamed protein product [Rotaria sp. Silwood1]|nr:unnamed protein product [Rotaria sp. Silwood1]CAF3764442.1 unnamed protein product [Rotaria sp. Silwood1]CAF3809284.1 unnamed protein product [Rotaria sp. Silwood1]CAF4728996.1 unnamed protein product [Rotaria sp. Silwood1]CAF4809059.1 unnamed protein product [Rotaria sp. Silwood1]